MSDCLNMQSLQRRNWRRSSCVLIDVMMNFRVRQTQDLRSLTGKRKKKLQTLVKEMSEARRRLDGSDSLSKTGSARQEVASQTTVNSAGDRLVSRAFQSLNSCHFAYI